ncbi:MAG: T9SS type A sorting domain-containing protein [Bacteroidia bacterium]|nr:T9SS type A sorting domain-containing protein [Bacteroidia bacterium]
MKKIFLLLIGLAFFTFKNNAQTISDIDGNVYNTVVINNRIWMQENLKVTKYRDGTIIPNVTINSSWANLSTGAYCDYNNVPTNSISYGRLYNWYTVNDIHGICPDGWYVPTDEDWGSLLSFLGGDSFSGGLLKETGTVHWTSPNTGATNASGFTALPAGTRYIDGVFGLIGSQGRFWSSTEYNITQAWWLILTNSSAASNKSYNVKTYGVSIRCIKDTATNVNEIINKNRINIHPNPFNDNLQIDFAESIYNIQIFNITGECILQKELNNNTNIIETGAIKAGYYLLRITTTNGIVNFPIVKY